MICIQKIYGFQGLTHQLIEESWGVTPVTDGGGKWKIGQCSELNQKPQKCKCKRWTTLSKKHFKSILLVFITRPTPFVEWYHTICGRASEKCIQMGRKYKKNRNLENFESAKTSRSISLCEKKKIVGSRRKWSIYSGGLETLLKSHWRPFLLL